MAYIINKFSGAQLIVLEDGTIDTSTSMSLVGRNYTGYGELQNENFVFLLENFSNSAPPSRPVTGQTWFDDARSLLHVYDGEKWTIVGAAVLSIDPPPGPTTGSLWLKSPFNTLYVWNGSQWVFVGPETAEGFAITRARSGTLLDFQGITRPVIFLSVDGIVIGIASREAFTIEPTVAPFGFANLAAGITLSNTSILKGTLEGVADRALRLETARTINSVAFDGQNNIVVRASTTRKLAKGDYILGSDFDGSIEGRWDIDATANNTIGKIVARDSTGGFAASTISANIIGNVQGNVDIDSGTSRFNVVEANSFIGATLSGNAFSSTKLQTARTINEVAFDGTGNITVPASAATLTGTQINPSVTDSALKTVGTLTSLTVADVGIAIGAQLAMATPAATATISFAPVLKFTINNDNTFISILDSASSLAQGEPGGRPSITPAVDNSINIGITTSRFRNVYAYNFKGNADSATIATTSVNLQGGGAGSIPYQTSSNVTALLPIGAPTQILRVGAGNVIQWTDDQRETLFRGTYLTGGNYNGATAATWSVDATVTNTANKIVARDASGNFSAGTITANLTGTVSGNAGSATVLQTTRAINGVAFNGSADITVSAIDPTKVVKTGDTMSGYLTLHANPVNALHAAPKQYVDSRLPQFTFVAGNTVFSTSGFTNQVGSWNNNANYFDVFPPAGKTMSSLVAFIPSIAVIHYAGGVNGDDSMRCTWSQLSDRIRVYVQNTEQRSTPAANYLAIWS